MPHFNRPELSQLTGAGPACGSEIQAERSLRDVLKRLGEAGDTLRKEESDLEEATRQYLQLICDSQVSGRATRGRGNTMTSAELIKSCRHDSGWLGVSHMGWCMALNDTYCPLPGTYRDACTRRMAPPGTF